MHSVIQLSYGTKQIQHEQYITHSNFVFGNSIFGIYLLISLLKDYKSCITNKSFYLEVLLTSMGLFSMNSSNFSYLLNSVINFGQVISVADMSIMDTQDDCTSLSSLFSCVSLFKIMSYTLYEPSQHSILCGYNDALQQIINNDNINVNSDIQTWAKNVMGIDKDFNKKTIRALNLNRHDKEWQNILWNDRLLEKSLILLEFGLVNSKIIYTHDIGGEYFIAAYGVPYFLCYVKQDYVDHKFYQFASIKTLYEIIGVQNTYNYYYYMYLYNLMSRFNLNINDQEYTICDLLLCAQTYIMEYSQQEYLFTFKEIYNITNINITKLSLVLNILYETLFSDNTYYTTLIFDIIKKMYDIPTDILYTEVDYQNTYYINEAVKLLDLNYIKDIDIDILSSLNSSDIYIQDIKNVKSLQKTLTLLKGIAIRKHFLNKYKQIFENVLEKIYDDIYNNPINYAAVEGQYSVGEKNEVVQMFNYTKYPGCGYSIPFYDLFILESAFKKVFNFNIAFLYNTAEHSENYYLDSNDEDFYIRRTMISGLLDFLNLYSLNDAINASIILSKNKEYTKFGALNSQASSAYYYGQGLLTSIANICLQSTNLQTSNITLYKLFTYKPIASLSFVKVANFLFNNNDQKQNYSHSMSSIYYNFVNACASSTPIYLNLFSYETEDLYSTMVKLLYCNLGQKHGVMIPFNYYFELINMSPEIMLHKKYYNLTITVNLKEFIIGNNYKYFEKLKQTLKYPNLLTIENAAFIHYLDKHCEISPLYASVMCFYDMFKLSENKIALLFGFRDNKTNLTENYSFVTANARVNFLGSSRYSEDIQVLVQDPIWNCFCENKFSNEKDKNKCFKQSQSIYNNGVDTIAYFEYGGLLPRLLNVNVFSPISDTTFLSFNIREVLVECASSIKYQLLFIYNINSVYKLTNKQSSLHSFGFLKSMYYKWCFNGIAGNDIYPRIYKLLYFTSYFMGSILNDKFYTEASQIDKKIYKKLSTKIPKHGMFIMKKVYDVKFDNTGNVFFSSNENNMSYEICFGLYNKFISLDLVCLLSSLLKREIFSTILFYSFKELNQYKSEFNIVYLTINLLTNSYLGKLLRSTHNRKSLLHTYYVQDEEIHQYTIFEDRSGRQYTDELSYNIDKLVIILFGCLFNKTAIYKEYENIKYASGDKVFFVSDIQSFVYNIFMNVCSNHVFNLVFSLYETFGLMYNVFFYNPNNVRKAPLEKENVNFEVNTVVAQNTNISNYNEKTKTKEKVLSLVKQVINAI